MTGELEAISLSLGLASRYIAGVGAVRARSDTQEGPVPWQLLSLSASQSAFSAF